MSRPACSGVSNEAVADKRTFAVVAADSIPFATCFTETGLVAFVVASCLKFCFSVSPACKLYVHLPSESTVVSTFFPSCNVILTVAPAIPVPDMLRSVELKSLSNPGVGVIVGAAGLATLSCEMSNVESSGNVATTTFVLSFVVPGANVTPVGKLLLLRFTSVNLSAKACLIAGLKLPFSTSLFP